MQVGLWKEDSVSGWVQGLFELLDEAEARYRLTGKGKIRCLVVPTELENALFMGADEDPHIVRVGTTTKCDNPFHIPVRLTVWGVGVIDSRILAQEPLPEEQAAFAAEERALVGAYYTVGVF